jgi:hypothetical protein
VHEGGFAAVCFGREGEVLQALEVGASIHLGPGPAEGLVLSEDRAVLALAHPRGAPPTGLLLDDTGLHLNRGEDLLAEGDLEIRSEADEPIILEGD